MLEIEIREEENEKLVKKMDKIIPKLNEEELYWLKEYKRGSLYDFYYLVTKSKDYYRFNKQKLHEMIEKYDKKYKISGDIGKTLKQLEKFIKTEFIPNKKRGDEYIIKTIEESIKKGISGKLRVYKITPYEKKGKFDGFLSTSLYPLFNFCTSEEKCHLYIIDIPENKKYLYLEHPEFNVENIPIENEILLGLNNKFKEYKTEEISMLPWYMGVHVKNTGKIDVKIKVHYVKLI